jgi:hypothetical protein
MAERRLLPDGAASELLTNFDRSVRTLTAGSLGGTEKVTKGGRQGSIHAQAGRIPFSNLGVAAVHE